MTPICAGTGRVLGDADAAGGRLVHEDLGGDVENGAPAVFRAIAVGRGGRGHLVRERQLAAPAERRDLDGHRYCDRSSTSRR